MKTDLEFSYCECGCHGYSAGSGDLSYWIYLGLGERAGGKPYRAHRGHGGYGIELGSCRSMAEAKERCDADASEKLVGLLETLGRLAPDLGRQP